MYYEINVSLNGTHFFATDKRSAQSTHQAKALVATFRKAFPKAEGYRITVTKWETLGQTFDLDTIDPPTPPVVTYLTKITELEGRVLDALNKSNDGNGGDFGIIEDITVDGLSRQALGGVLTSLQAKNIITVHEAILVNGDTRVTQFTFNNR
jgi:hypothetical protein